MAKKDKEKENKDPKKQDAEKTENAKSEDTKGKKGKKGKGKKGSQIDAQALDRSKMSAEEFSQAQMEEAIKESQDPSTKLKKIRGPFTVANCLINILVLIILTVGIVLLICYIMLDKSTFDLGVVIKDMSDKFGITKFFKTIGNWFKKTFTGGK